MARQTNPKTGKGEASIIKIIQDMVRAGEPEEKIIKTLRDLGVTAQQAKRLLLLSEANTFALVRSEISKVVEDVLDRKKAELTGHVEEQTRRVGEQLSARVEKRALEALKADQSYIENQALLFQGKINQSVRNIVELNEQIKARLEDLAARIGEAERDVGLMKAKVVGTKGRRAVGFALIAVQIALLAATLYVFVTRAAQGFTPEIAAAIVVILVALIAMLYFVVVK